MRLPIHPLRLTLLVALGLSLAAGPAIASPGSIPRPAASRITISSSPNPSVTAAPVTITGRVGGGRRGVRVELWRRLAGWRRSHRAGTTRTGAGGRFSFSMPAARVTTTRWWYVTAGDSRSRRLVQRVSAMVTLSSSETNVAPGDEVALGGTVSPAQPQRWIELEQNLGAGWVVLGRVRLDSHSRFYLVHPFTQLGGVQVRAFLPNTGLNINSLSAAATLSVAEIHKIKHVVIIMQENRSFDTYFGTYPGADGIPGGVCVPDPLGGGCVAPFHDSQDVNNGGPHGAANYLADLNAGKMDGFVGQAEKGASCTSTNPRCSPCKQGQTTSCVDVMGYRDAREIPNYWTYAKQYVLQDHMFEPNSSWSLPQHLYQVSEWSAFCTNPMDPMSCTNALQNPNSDASGGVTGANDGQLHYAWTDITYLLHKNNVSWGYYVFKGTEPDCESDTSVTCAPVNRPPGHPASGTRCRRSPTSPRTGRSATSRACPTSSPPRRPGRSRTCRGSIRTATSPSTRRLGSL